MTESRGPELHLLISIGILLIAITLGATTLAYSLRDYSAARVADHLPESVSERWLNWFDQHAADVAGLAGAVRMLANIGLLVVICLAYFDYVGAPIDATLLAAPALIAAAALIVFSISLPQSLSRHVGPQFLAGVRGALPGLRIALAPVRVVLAATDWLVRRLLGKSAAPPDHGEQLEREILEAVAEGELKGAVGEQQREMIQSVFGLHQTAVSAVMTPRTEIIALPINATAAQIVDVLRDGGHSRVPVFEESLDHIVGVLYAKDLIGAELNQSVDLRARLRAAPYVPETKPIDELLREFKLGKIHIAIVLDEYGGTSGLVTIEDILEEVVGEIDDEYDERATPPIRRIDESTIEVDARVHVAEVNTELDLSIPDNGVYETIGGFVLARLGKIPAVGEEFLYENCRIRVLEAEPRKINRLRIGVIADAAG